MKRIISVLLAALFLLPLMSVGVFAEDQETHDWEKYENYFYYNYQEGRTSGYTLNAMIVGLSEEFTKQRETVTAEDFGDFASRIKSLKYYPAQLNSCVIFLNEDEYEKDEAGNPIYTTEAIDRVINDAKYLLSLDYITFAEPNFSMIFSPLDPKDWEIYDNYYYYNYSADKMRGYSLRSVIVTPTDDFLNQLESSGGELTPDYFGDVAPEIVNITYAVKTYFVTLKEADYEKDEAGNPIYTEEQIDRVIEIVRKINVLGFVKEAKPDSYTRVYPDTTDTGAETGDETDAVTENETLERSNDTKSPQMGYTSYTYPVTALLIASFLGLVSTIIYRRKTIRR